MIYILCVRAKLLQLCPALCDPMDSATLVHWAPLSMGFSGQEYWSGLPCPPLGDLPDPGFKPMSPMSPALAGRFFTTSATWDTEAGNFKSGTAREGQTARSSISY